MVRVGNTPEGVEVHQLLCGRDVATGDDPVCLMAAQMANYMYVVIDKETRSAVVIDGCWDVDGIIQHCLKDLGVKAVSSAIYTHRHFDHTGGRLPRAMTRGRTVVVPGLHSFVEQGIPVAVGKDDLMAVAKQSDLAIAKIRALEDGDSVQLHDGDASAELVVLHTPGHTTGSICFLLKASKASAAVLFTGDTLFIGSCGRYDLPESDFKAMLTSLTRLSQLPKETLVLPGHNYARPAHSTIGAERDMNDMMIQAMSLAKPPKGLTPQDAAAALPLPDYLGVAERLAERFRQVAHTSSSQECEHGHTPLPFFTEPAVNLPSRSKL
eukprot:TRINITY_DN78144_c0_g1_i1.p1 TRINITY_DN78144_c0_g1~~TRINITY_DN78144_c0_g1_i1.p1  ORF type:complete len:324 (-),score=70.31 TRINITY_DN78144_c0_g1_i1:33-1004(-)